MSSVDILTAEAGLVDAVRAALCTVDGMNDHAAATDACLEVESGKQLEQSDICTIQCRHTHKRAFCKVSSVFDQLSRRGDAWILETEPLPPSETAAPGKVDVLQAKWSVTATSYRNELSFYALLDRPGSSYRAKLLEAHTAVPQLLFGRVNAPVLEPIHQHVAAFLHTTVVLGLEYLPVTPVPGAVAYTQHKVFNRMQTETVLKALAAFHAAFWDDGQAVCFAPHSDALRVGAWWRRELRPSVDFATAPVVFAAACRAIPACAHLGTPDNVCTIASLAEAKAAIAAYTTDAAAFRTLVHGDPKTSNVFFPITEVAEGGCSTNLQWIDFQWTGPARSGMADVIYLLVGGVDRECLDAFDDLLEVYYAALVARLGDDARYPRPDFERDSAMEFLDYFTTAVPQLLRGISPELCRVNATKYGWLTHEFDEAAIAWFFTRGLRTAALAGERGYLALPPAPGGTAPTSTDRACV